MVKHIVMWRLTDEYQGKNKDEIAPEIKRLLEGLAGKIPSLRHIEVGIDFNKSEVAYDLALYSEFDDKQGLNEYQNHPEHLKAASYVRSVTVSRAVADYEY